MTQFRISENILASTSIGGLPFLLLYMLTLCVYNSRYYEVYNRPRDFATESDPFPWTIDQMTNPFRPDQGKMETIMLANLLQQYLQDPAERQIPALQVTRPPEEL